jgi:DNA repair photolyase
VALPQWGGDQDLAGDGAGQGADLELVDEFDSSEACSAEHGTAPRGGDGAATRVRTRVYRDRSRTIINRVESPELPFRWTINPYRGCEHGCIYCYARPTHEYLGLSSGLDFETQIFAKTAAAELLVRELSAKDWRGETIMMSGVTDAYQPAERRLKITRACLEVMAPAGQPVSIVTKSGLVRRDIDLLTSLARRGAARVAISLTTLDRALASRLEPRACAPDVRLRAIRELAEAGIPVGVMVAPVIPGLTDHELPALLQAAARAGAGHAGMVLLRLPWQNKALFLDWLERHAPLKASKVEGLIRGSRGGRLYDSSWEQRWSGTGPVAEQIGQTFRVFAKRLGLDGPLEPLSSAGFVRPLRGALDPGQLPLFNDV